MVQSWKALCFLTLDAHCVTIQYVAGDLFSVQNKENTLFGIRVERIFSVLSRPRIARLRRCLRAALAIVAAWCCCSLTARALDLTLADFNGTGFDYTFDDFTQTLGPTAVRLDDPSNGWGGGGIVQSLDLSSHAGSRFVVDMFTNPGNQTDLFELELYDSSDRSGKWTFNVSNLGVSTPSTMVSATTLDSPTHGVGDYQNLDLSDISRWNILGEYNGSNPFDISFDRVIVSDSAPTPPAYPGAEPNAPWRTEAAARIAANRMANLQVNVTDSLGNAVSGANIAVEMIEHEFGFGSAVVGWRLRDNDPAHDAYKQKVDELFNLATIENNLKWPPWEGEWGSSFTQQGAQNAITWLAGQGIDVRGHTLVWPGYDNLPISVKNILDGAPLNATEQTALRNVIAAHIAEVGGTFAGQLSAWDVINEERANHDLMDNLSEGDLAMVDWFHQAQSADPSSARYINDYGILSSGGGTNTSNQQEYYNTIEFLINNGAPIDGIGFQSHFSESSLTGPEQLWDILDQFQQLGLDMQITEFDFGTTDEQLQAEYTRDFLTAVFAHEGMDDFVMWGFWEDAHWRPDAAMFRSDWSMKPNGQAYLDLVFDEWWTSENLVAGLGGLTELNGFKGEYQVTVSHNDEQMVVSATLTDGGLVLDVALPILSADFDGNGQVGTEDFAIWSGNYGVAFGATQTDGDADGDGDVDGYDMLLVQQQFGTSVVPLATTVPEPRTACLFALQACIIAGLFRRRVALIQS